MPKKPDLKEVFKVDENELQPKPELQVVEPQPKPTAKAEAKKKHIGGYFPPDVYQQMKILCAETGMTTQEILKKGLNAVFRMHDKPPIA
ncbi:hypothetical protein C6499_22880 [Candidatus Poribacteria bacterium]|nr:MAG: hypothetical protein C6499_22880 [Candidatus Poribacteria bacterium]